MHNTNDIEFDRFKMLKIVISTILFILLWLSTEAGEALIGTILCVSVWMLGRWLVNGKVSPFWPMVIPIIIFLCFTGIIPMDKPIWPKMANIINKTDKDWGVGSAYSQTDEKDIPALQGNKINGKEYAKALDKHFDNLDNKQKRYFFYRYPRATEEDWIIFKQDYWKTGIDVDEYCGSQINLYPEDKYLKYDPKDPYRIP